MLDTTFINLNGRIFSNQQVAEPIEKVDGFFEKQAAGVLLKNIKGEVIAFIANGLRRKESPFLVSAKFVEKAGAIRYQWSLCSMMDKFFNAVPEGELYPDRQLKKVLDRDISIAVEMLYGKVHSGIAI